MARTPLFISTLLLTALAATTVNTPTHTETQDYDANSGSAVLEFDQQPQMKSASVSLDATNSLILLFDNNTAHLWCLDYQIIDGYARVITDGGGAVIFDDLWMAQPFNKRARPNRTSLVMHHYHRYGTADIPNPESWQGDGTATVVVEALVYYSITIGGCDRDIVVERDGSGDQTWFYYADGTLTDEARDCDYLWQLTVLVPKSGRVTIDLE